MFSNSIIITLSMKLFELSYPVPPKGYSIHNMTNATTPLQINS